MEIILFTIVIWIGIGVLINIIVNRRIPFLSRYDEQDIEDLLFDIKYGPFGPIMYFYYVWKEHKNNK